MTTTCTDSAQHLLNILGDNLITDNLIEIIQRITTDHVNQDSVVAAMSSPKQSTNSRPPLEYPTARREKDYPYPYQVVSAWWLFVAFTIGFFVALIAFVI